MRPEAQTAMGKTLLIKQREAVSKRQALLTEVGKNRADIEEILRPQGH